jgi:tryptophan synthase alpha chain
VRKVTDKPLCVGFGISSPAQARQVAEVADGVIVGSRLIQLMEEDSALKKAGLFVKELEKAINGAD